MGSIVRSQRLTCMGLHSIRPDINHVLCDAAVVGEGAGDVLCCAHTVLDHLTLRDELLLLFNC